VKEAGKEKKETGQYCPVLSQQLDLNKLDHTQTHIQYVSLLLLAADSQQTQ
jgi:hypothetical protein